MTPRRFAEVKASEALWLSPAACAAPEKGPAVFRGPLRSLGGGRADWPKPLAGLGDPDAKHPGLGVEPIPEQALGIIRQVGVRERLPVSRILHKGLDRPAIAGGVRSFALQQARGYSGA
jgi:hypothetical protein